MIFYASPKVTTQKNIEVTQKKGIKMIFVSIQKSSKHKEIGREKRQTR